MKQVTFKLLSFFSIELMQRKKSNILLWFLSFFLSSASLEAEKVLRRSNLIEPGTLDPHRILSYYERNLVQDLFVGLYSYRADGSIVEGIAKEVQISEGGLCYKFSLRPSCWSNGEPLTSEDFVYSFQRFVNPESAVPYSFLLEKVRGASAISRGKENDLTTLGVHAPDPMTLIIYLEEPVPYFLKILSMAHCSPVHRSTVEQFGFRWTRAEHWVSNGAFVLSEWSINEKIVLHKNPHFYAQEEVEWDSVIYFSPSEQVEWLMYQTNAIDITMSVPAEQLSHCRKRLPDQLFADPLSCVAYLSFNCEHFPPATSRSLRRALSLAIDREVLVHKVLRGEGDPLLSLIPRGVGNYFSPLIDDENLSQVERETEAQKLIQDPAVQSFLPLLEILYPLDQKNRKLITALLLMWKKVLGIQVASVGEEWKSFLSKRVGHQFYIECTKWLANYDDPHTFFSLFFSENSGMNTSQYTSEEFDRLFLLAEREEDEQERVALWREAEKWLIAQEQIVIPLFQKYDFHLVSPRLSGWIPNSRGSHPSYLLHERNETKN